MDRETKNRLINKLRVILQVLFTLVVVLTIAGTVASTLTLSAKLLTIGGILAITCTVICMSIEATKPRWWE